MLFEDDDVPEEFGWVAWLAPAHARLFAGELWAALRQPAATDDLALLLEEWKATAELDNAPGIQQQVVRNRASKRFAPVGEWLKKSRTA